MSLTDLMSGMKLSTWPIMALALFLAVFVSVMWRTFRKSARQDHAETAQLPLDDAPVVSDSKSDGTLHRTN
jgi:cbb3-type cytochrome oxidase subunit 3